MTEGERAVEEARLLVGTRFVAQGRDPAVGLDCVGLILRAYAIDAAKVRDDYRLSGDHRAAILHFAEARFRRVARGCIRTGDVLLLRIGASQWHLALWTGSGLIHADAVSRRIVERPGGPAWPVVATLRPRVRAVKGS